MAKNESDSQDITQSTKKVVIKTWIKINIRANTNILVILSDSEESPVNDEWDASYLSMTGQEYT